ncbi:hypothetical protein NYY89_21090, partial [Acinetobacter baumannii]|nr:hypothetical protein [Acinetobacter baumannii]
VTLWRIASNLNGLRALMDCPTGRVNLGFVTFWRKSCVKNKERPVCFFSRRRSKPGGPNTQFLAKVCQ